MRRSFLWRQVWWAAGGIAAIYGIPFAFDLLFQNFERLTRAAAIGLTAFTLTAVFRYATLIAPVIRHARETLRRMHESIDAADRSKNAAHNAELQFEYDVAHRRATVSVLRRTRELAKSTLDALRIRLRDLETLAASFTLRPIAPGALAIPIVEDADVDAWYERTIDDRKPFVREFPVTRAQSRRMSADELRQRIVTYAATAFDAFREMTLAEAASLTPSLPQRLKRFSQYSAPLIELKGDDLQAQKAMQRDTTLWMDSTDTAFVTSIQRRLPEMQMRPSPDALRVHALSRVLHYPAYVLGQFDYYRAHYDPAQFPESADVPDLLPTELVLTGDVRAAYEQILLGRATGVITLRQDGQLHRASTSLVLGDTHLAAAQHLAAPEHATLREQLEVELAPRLSVAKTIEHDLQQLAREVKPLSALDADVLGRLLRRYGSEF
jgi:hypothetical protein